LSFSICKQCQALLLVLARPSQVSMTTFATEEAYICKACISHGSDCTSMLHGLTIQTDYTLATRICIQRLSIGRRSNPLDTLSRRNLRLPTSLEVPHASFTSLDITTSLAHLVVELKEMRHTQYTQQRHIPGLCRLCMKMGLPNIQLRSLWRSLTLCSGD